MAIAMAIRAGFLRHQVTIQYLATGSPQLSASGEPNETWADFATVRAAIEPLKGRELQAAQAMQAEVEVKISTWYLSGVEPTMRVVHNSKYYSIVSVINPRLMNRELELMCTEGINIG